MTQTAEAPDKTAYHIPEQYRNDAGTGFRPGYDAKYKSQLIKDALDYENISNGRTDSEAHTILGEGGAFGHWQHHLVASRKTQQAKADRVARRQAETEERKAAREQAKVAAQEAKAETRAEKDAAKDLEKAKRQRQREAKTFVIKGDRVFDHNGQLVRGVDVRIDGEDADTLVTMINIQDQDGNDLGWVDRAELTEVEPTPANA